MKATPETYRTLRHFRIRERWGVPGQMEVDLLLALDEARARVGRPFYIHSAYRGGAVAPSGQPSKHASGEAVDLRIEGLSVVDQYLAIERAGVSLDIGLYPDWNRPGLHLELPDREQLARWVRFGRSEYQPLTSETLGRALLRPEGREVDS